MFNLDVWQVCFGNWWANLSISSRPVGMLRYFEITPLGSDHGVCLGFQYLRSLQLYTMTPIVNICSYQVRRRSRCMPKYFTSSAGDNRGPFNRTGQRLTLFGVNITHVHFVPLILIFYFLNHVCSDFKLT